jgi:hypothetical protein
MRDAVQGWYTSVRGTISKARFVQGAQHPRTFRRDTSVGDTSTLHPLNLQRCVSKGNLSNRIGQMKVMWLAWLYRVAAIFPEQFESFTEVLKIVFL